MFNYMNFKIFETIAVANLNSENDNGLNATI